MITIGIGIVVIIYEFTRELYLVNMSDVLYSPLFVTNTKVLPLLLLSLFSVAVIIMHAQSLE